MSIAILRMKVQALPTNGVGKIYSAEIKREIIDAVKAYSGSVEDACKAIGIPHQTYYNWVSIGDTVRDRIIAYVNSGQKVVKKLTIHERIAHIDEQIVRLRLEKRELLGEEYERLGQEIDKLDEQQQDIYNQLGEL